MKKCDICGKKNGSFFKVPTDERRRQQWSNACNKTFKQTAKLCGDHFLPTDFIVGARLTLMPSAVPSVGIVMQTTVNSLNGNLAPVSNASNREDGCHSFKSINSLNGNVAPVSNASNRKDGCHSFESTDCLFEMVFDEPTVSVAEMKEERIDCCTQTDNNFIVSCSEIENYKLRSEVRKLKCENSKLKEKFKSTNGIIASMSKIFTENQIRKMQNPEKNVHWRWEDISASMSLHACGRRAYNQLYKKGFPLPNVSSLQRWARQIVINEGILNVSFDFLRSANDLSSDDKVCVITFDEMKVAQDSGSKSSNYVQVVLARSLRTSWKQPIFFDYDCKPNKELILQLIILLHEAGYPVVAMVCDMRLSNRELWESLEVTTEKPWFQSPVSIEDKVFVFADAPHLLQLIRNQFIDTGLMWQDIVLNSKTVTDLLEQVPKSTACKLTTEHLSAKGLGRQKVKLAAQLFSSSTANEIVRCYSHGIELYEAIKTADLFQLLNDWFDVLNSSIKTMNTPGKEPYGLKLTQQNVILTRMTEFMSSPIIPGQNTLEYFQNGVLITNASLSQLHQYFTEKYNADYIVTNRLNQDVLQNFFDTIRSKGKLNAHPSPEEFKLRMRKYVLDVTETVPTILLKNEHLTFRIAHMKRLLQLGSDKM